MSIPIPMTNRRALSGPARLVAAALVPALVLSMHPEPVYAHSAARPAPAVPSLGKATHGTALKVKPRRADPSRAATLTAPPKVAWPAAGVTDVDLAAGRRTATVGGLSVVVAPAAARAAAIRPAPGKVRLRVFDRAASARARVSGPMLAVAPVEAAAQSAPVSLSLGYAGFADAFGGSYGARLRLVRLPACAVTTPERAECRTSTPIAGATNDAITHTLTASLPAAPSAQGMTVLAAEADNSSSQGDYKATSLSPSSKWDVSLASGGFNWTYPLRTPPVPGGLTPQVGLAYSSQAIDGVAANTNNQGSWIGEGFSYEPGYIERRYKPCAEDGHKTVGDQCWAVANASIMLNGRSGELVKVSDSEWKLANDDGTKIERLTGATNGDNDGEHWKATTIDGTQYFFGLNRLPGWTAGKAETKSAWTVPVFGDDSGEPCYKSSGFDDSYCDQGWRWNLDYVKDLHGNVISYFYNTEINRYARNAKTDVDGTDYVRGGWLQRIDYGQTDGTVYTSAAPARVRFDTAERCLPSGAITCAESQLSDSTAANWPDVPWDQNCAASTHCKIKQSSPTFWTRKRLTTITTDIRTGATWTPVEKWSLDQDFKDNGDGSKALWLANINHTGLYGDTVSMPPVNLVGIQMPNRIDNSTDNLPPMNRYRLNTVYTDTGEEIQVNYAPPDCAAGSLPTDGNSQKRCFAIKWNGTDSEKKITDWFHKYVVGQIIEVDRTGGNPDMVTSYQYASGSTTDADPINGAAWRKPPPDGIGKDEDRTWSQWRGYPRVIVRKGDMQTLTTRVDHYFLRGMDGDDKPSGGTRDVTVTDSTGGTYTDADQFAGTELESVTYDGSAVVSKTITRPVSWSTATQTENWGTRKAWMVRPETESELTALDPAVNGSARWRETKQTTTYDHTWGRRTKLDDQGDLAVATDDTCQTTQYADNADLRLYTLKKLDETFSVPCATIPDRASQLIASERTSYDRPDQGPNPTKGDVTKVETLDTATATTTAYLSTDTLVDDFGRVTQVTDSAGRVTKTAYTDVDGLNTTKTDTNPLKQTTSTELLPAFGVTAATVDPNGKRTDMAYDGLGRLRSIWTPIRAKALGYTPSIKYTYVVRADQAAVTKTETIRNNGTYKPSYELFDGLLRTRQTQAEGPDDGWLLEDTLYTSTGQQAQTNDSYFALGTPGDQPIVTPEGSTNGQTRFLYDGADRVTNEITLMAGDERWRSTTTYGGDRKNITPPTGGTPTTTVTDAQGHTTDLYQYRGTTPSGPADVTHYTYTPAGKPATVVGPDGATWRYTYDQRGNKVQAVDPDTGTTTLGYDNANNVTTVTDARSTTVSNVYDVLDRKIETWQGAPTTGTKLAAWTYDSYYKGQLAGTARFVNSKAYYITYPVRDAQYRALKTSYIVPSDAGAELAKVYDFTTTYNVDGTVQGTGMPAAGGLAAENTVVGYDALQRPTTLTGTTSYVTAAAYANTGQLMQTTLWTGGSAPKAWQTNTYDRGTTQRIGVRLDRATVPAVDMDTHYRYDNAGNLRSIADTPTGGQRDIQCFTYDTLRRLTEAWTTTSTDVDPCAAGGDSGGPAPYHQKWTFDTAGDRTEEKLLSTTGGTDTVRTYHYQTSQPHAVRSVDEVSANGTNTYTYGYDPAGNTTARPASGQNAALNWDAEGHLATAGTGAQVTSYIYDADGGLLLRKEPTATTLYLNGMELRLDTTTRQVTGTRYYTFGDDKVAVRTMGGVNFQVADHHSTNQASIDATTGAITWRRTTPYGDVRGSAPTRWPDQRGFVGGAIDPANGLTLLGARHYDTTIGRFISVDPEIDPNEPQSLNGYGYANNSPLTFSDPQGTSWGTFWKVAAVVAIVVVVVAVVVVAGPAIAAAAAAVAAESAAAGTAGVVATAAAEGAVATGTLSGAAVAAGGQLAVAAGGALGGTGAAATALTVAGGAAGIATRGTPGDPVGLPRGARASSNQGKSGTAPPRPASAGCMSFGGDTKVLLGDGTRKPFRDLTDGDFVLAADPETGIQGPRRISDVWVHGDYLFTLSIDGHKILTTEDHPFWNDTDQRWEQADQLDPGDLVRTPSGKRAAVGSFDWLNPVYAPAYNLTVDDLHTYYVLVGNTPVLVHNRPDNDEPGYNVGTYSSLAPSGPGKERHHVPPHSVRPNGRSYGSGPAIRMDKADHRALYSTGSSLESQAWRQWQSELIQSGRADEAMEMEYGDIQQRFPGKYDEDIAQHRALYANPSCP